MRISKQRLESFSDGVIAIIITIMVLSIPLPQTLTPQDIGVFLNSILVYFLSFVGVGAFWIQHNRAFRYVENVTRTMIWLNLLFLFFLSLMPLLTNWVMANPDEIIPALGYNIIYILINLSYVLILHYILTTSEQENAQQLKERMNRLASKHPRTVIWLRLLISVVVIFLVLALLVFTPVVSNKIRLFLPVASAVFNMLYDELYKPKKAKSTKKMAS